MSKIYLTIILSIFLYSCASQEAVQVDYYGKNLKNNNSKKIIVKSGDTLSKIAKQYNINMNELAKINNLSYPYTIKLGQSLIIESSTNINENQKKEIIEDNSDYNPYSNVKIKQLDAPSIEKPIVKKIENTDNSVENKKAEANKQIINSKFIWPLRGKIITNFGPTVNGGKNDGINIEANLKTNVIASAGGKVVYSGNGLKGYGNLIIIRHDEDMLTAYAHLDNLIIDKNAIVNQGQIIGHVGSSGNVSSPQLHFAVRKGKKPINPIDILPKNE